MLPSKQKKKANKIDYILYRQRLVEFINNFEDFTNKQKQQQQCYSKYGNKKYLIQMQKVVNYDSMSIQILVEDIQQFLRKDDQKQIIKHLRENTHRFISLFQSIIAELLPQRNKPVPLDYQLQQKYNGFIKKQRQDNQLMRGSQLKDINQKIPSQLYQHYDVHIIFGNNAKFTPKTISEITAGNIGQLVYTKAIVIRSSDVKPQLQVATYACEICGYQIYDVSKGDSQYKPLIQCRSSKCVENRVTGRLSFLPGNSKFKSFQELKIQQIPEQLQRGAIPKSIKLQLRGNMTNMISPGDLVSVQGVILPRQISRSFQATDLYFQNYFYVMKIVQLKKKYSDFNMSQKQQEQINEQRKLFEQNQDLLINNLAKSIAPQIYGLDNVKKALLYQMAGGVIVRTVDNLRIRGQINIALFGDPGIAKSQLLKHISYVSPRAVYTTGKGSSGVGLTAAIVADPVTKQLSLQAGALVLADMGICCIDEFDKMDQNDRTAIHQVMQQQTVSITKAGIITSLNARTAVLAAANPIWGRYNRQQTIHKNLNLPAALLSRFDLIFILLDQINHEKDLQLSIHIGNVHQKKKAEVHGIYNQKFLKNYIAMAKKFEPVIPEQIHQAIIQKYTTKRLLQTKQSQQGDQYTTMRSLLGIIRLAQARAKLRFSDTVTLQDVMDCIELIQDTQSIVKKKDTFKSKKYDKNTLVYDLIRDTCVINNNKKQVDKQKLYIKCMNRGFGREFVDLVVQNYVNLNVLYENNTHIGLVDNK